jgi:hypothetical protein
MLAIFTRFVLRWDKLFSSNGSGDFTMMKTSMTLTLAIGFCLLGLPGDGSGPGKSEKLLVDVYAQSKKMLDLQVEVFNATRALSKTIDKLPSKKARPEDQQTARRLAEKQKKLVADVTKVIDLLEKEGGAVAFPEVFHQVRKDMQVVQGRLETTEVGANTQAIQRDIIDTFEEMVRALNTSR